jgi:hypothetical protein
MILIDNNLILMDKYEEPDVNPNSIQSIVNISPITPNSHTNITYKRVPDTSRESRDTQILLEGYIETGEFIKSEIENGRTVGVHCNNGFQRSIPFLAWYLQKYKNVPIEDTVSKITDNSLYVEKVKEILKNI